MGRALNRDRDIYGPDADEFNPDRHLDEKGRIAPVAEDIPLGHVTFGFGRRQVKLQDI
jgi:cytochrome P450